MSGVRGLEIDWRNVQRKFPHQGLDEEFRNFDIRDEWDGEVNSHASRAVTLTCITGWSAVMVARGEVDIQIDHIVRQVLREGILEFLSFSAQGFKILGVLFSKLQRICTGSTTRLARYVVFHEEVGGPRGREKFEASSMQFLNARQ